MHGPDLTGLVLEGRYQIGERVAEGAMGVVYRGVRLNLDRAVAIKVMHASLPGAMEARKRFDREAMLMARLEHPHCVSIIDFGVHGDKPYVVMELVRGRSLYDAIVEQGRFEIPRAVDILCQVLSGLAHAHEQGIIHRDIKPANIMITPKAPLGVHARILDFGLARMLAHSASLSAGVAVGTPSYMAPEQCRGDTPDARVDIYACGVLLFEMLTGKKPFIAKDPIAIIRKQLEEMPPRLVDTAPGDYGGLEGVVARALAKSPGDRYPSAVAMAEALHAVLGGRSGPDATAEFAAMGSSALVTAESSSEEPTAGRSFDVPITVGSSMIETPVGSSMIETPVGSSMIETAQAAPPSPGTKVSDPHDSSVLRRSLPISRARYVVLAALLAIAGGIVGLVMLRRQAATNDRADDARADAGVRAVVADAAPAPVAPTDPASQIAATANQLAASGKVEAAIEKLLAGRRLHPDRAVLPLTLGKLYLAKLWWDDGIANLREAVRIDPALRRDADLIKAVIRGFLTTPEYDRRLGDFLLELGQPAAPLLEETARTHPNPQKRSRATAMLRRLK